MVVIETKRSKVCCLMWYCKACVPILCMTHMTLRTAWCLRSFVANWAAQTFADWRCPATRQVFVASSAQSSKVQPVANPHGFSWFFFNHDVLKKVIQKYDMNSWNMVLSKLMPWRFPVCTCISCPAHVIQIFMTLLHDWAQQNLNPASMSWISGLWGHPWGVHRIVFWPTFWKPPAASDFESVTSSAPHPKAHPSRPADIHIIHKAHDVWNPAKIKFQQFPHDQVAIKIKCMWKYVEMYIRGTPAKILVEGKHGSHVQFLRRFINNREPSGASSASSWSEMEQKCAGTNMIESSLCGGLIGLSRDLHSRKSVEFHKELREFKVWVSHFVWFCDINARGAFSLSTIMIIMCVWKDWKFWTFSPWLVAHLFGRLKTSQGQISNLQQLVKWCKMM